MTLKNDPQSVTEIRPVKNRSRVPLNSISSEKNQYLKVAIHQPQYFPWPPYLHKIMSADVFVYLDVVQFSKNGIQNRNQIKNAQGASWLTIPVKHHLGLTLQEMQLADSAHGIKHWKTLQANYARAPGFVKWRNELEQLLTREYSYLADIAIASCEWMLEKLSVDTRRVRASQLEGLEGDASKLVASICRATKATSYLTGTGALAYLNLDDFSRIECEVQVQEWRPIVYEQVNPKAGFVPDLSALDLLLNCPDTARQIIDSAGGWKLLS